MPFATGYRPDPAGYPRTPFHHLAARFGAGFSVPSSASLLAKAPAVMDQGSGPNATSACTGHAVSVALKATLGDLLPFVPSPADIYKLGRCIDRLPYFDGSFSPLDDHGTAPNAVIRAVGEWGIRPMRAPTPDGRYSDADAATINAEPDFLDLQRDSLLLAVGAYAVPPTPEAVRTAIAAGYAVTAAIEGSADVVQRYGGGVIASIGTRHDHYIALIEFDADGSFTGQNSWGAGWGEGGRFRLAEGALVQCGDLYAFDVRLLGKAAAA
ncbi:MAG: hypothetical protein NVS3B7_16790 [Candidatus Elarobacter sp.]